MTSQCEFFRKIIRFDMGRHPFALSLVSIKKCFLAILKKGMPLNDGSSRRILVPLPFFCDTNVIRDLPNINDREDEEHVEKKHLLIFWVFALFFVFAAFDVLLTIHQRNLDRCLASPLVCFVMLWYALLCFGMFCYGSFSPD